MFMQAFSYPSMEATKQRRQNPHLFSLLSLAHLSLFSLLFSFTITATCNAVDSNFSSPYHPTEVIALSCGSSAKTPTLSLSLTWNSDTTSKFGPFPFSTTTTATATTQAPSVQTVPYMTARLSTSRFNYTFPVSNGMKFVRLHFYPASYSGGHDINNSFFSVTVNDRFTLLSNFSASLTALSLQTPNFVKEYSVNVEDQKLTLSFAPSPENPYSFAFINGIEIVSMPETIYIQGPDVSIPIVGELDTRYHIDYTSALETIHRLNVGEGSISAGGDSGMFREWISDDKFVRGYPGVTSAIPDLNITYTKDTPAYIAPENVYRTARSMGPYKNVNKISNLTWSFRVDSGFNYLVRLHFCETFYQNITKQGDRVFHIFINNQTVSSEADIFHWSGGIGFPIYRDYYSPYSEGGDLSVALHPNPDTETRYSDAFLNGLELFKLSSDGNLAGPNPEPPLQLPSAPAEPSKNTNPRRFPVALVGSLVASVAVFSLLLCAFIWWHRQQRRRKVKDSGEKTSSWSTWWVLKPDTNSNTGSSSLPSDLCRHFSLAEIRAATNDFDSNLLIGVGGFGHVYKGYVGRELTPVAVKRAKLNSQQGSREFLNEIEMLSKLRHVHLVSLIGYSDEQEEMILVYDYMAQGTLRDHLYKSNNPSLSWKQRLNICIGAARGLYYLHTGAKHTIIHRDVKTTNILLDDQWVAKVSDFGLSKVGPTSVLDSHVSTVVKGTLGYLDPEYYLRQQLTAKSDVYSFGVVLFEVLCARPALDKSRGREEVSLAEWAPLCRRRKMLHQIIDPHLKGTIAAESLERFAEIAENCLGEEGNERPSMGDVVWSLEFALQLQETAERNAMQCLGNLNLSLGESDDGEIPLTESFVAGIRDDLPSSSATDQEESSLLSGPSRSGQGNSSEEDTSRSMSKNVFSELMNPNGR